MYNLTLAPLYINFQWDRCRQLQHEQIILIIKHKTNVQNMLQTDNHNFNNPHNFQFSKTPNRHRPPTYNQTIKNQYNSREDARSLSPNKLNATKKPMIAPPSQRNIFPPNHHISNQRTQRNVQNLSNNYRINSLNKYGNNRCQNHPAKVADFIAMIDGEKLPYCQKCAINVASNGFEVSKIGVQSPKNMNKNNKFLYGNQKYKLQPFNFPQFASVEGYEDLKAIISQLDGVYFRYQQQLGFFNSIQSYYQQQFNLTQNFYENLLMKIEEMKEAHLNDLVDLSKKHIQTAEIKIDHLNSDVDEMQVIRNDIFDRLELILQNFRNPEYDNCLAFYKQHIYAYSDKIDEEKQQFDSLIIKYKPEQLDYRLRLIEEYLLDVWDIKPNQKTTERREQQNQFTGIPHQQNRRSQQKQVHKSPMNNIIGLGNGNQPIKKQTGTACRKLFDDDDADKDLIAEQTSPQFKAI